MATSDEYLLAQILAQRDRDYQSNPWAVAGSSLANMPMPQTDSPWTNTLGAFARGIAPGIQVYGRKQVDQSYGGDNGYMSQLADIIGSPSREDALNSPGAAGFKEKFADILPLADIADSIETRQKKEAAAAELAKTQAEIQKRQQLVPILAQEEGAKEKAKVEAQAPIKQAEAKTKESEALFSLTDKLRGEISSAPEFKAYSEIQPQIKALRKWASDDKASTDPAFLYSYFKILDPGSTVREGEIHLADTSNPLLVSLVNRVNKDLKGGSGIGVSTKKAMVTAVEEIVEARRQQYAAIAAPRVKYGESRGVKPEDIVMLPFESQPSGEARFEIRTGPDGKRYKVLLGQ